MPIYDFEHCGSRIINVIAKVDERHSYPCPRCGQPMTLMPSAPRFRIWGQVTPGGGPDKFTADMLGIPLKELPEGLKA